MTSGKKIDRSAHIGDAGIALIHRRVSSMGHVWHPRGLDAGIDGTIELRDPATGVMSNRHILVQSKASDGQFPGETEDKFHYICDDRDVDYWMKADEPVILVCSHPRANGAWWAHVQGSFADPARRAKRRIDFNKATQAFTQNSSERLLALADPHGRAHTAVSDYRAEVLVSNLLPVEIPDAYYSCRADATEAKAVYDAQRASELDLRHDFVLQHHRLLTWEPPEGTSLGALATAPVAMNPVNELAGGDADSQRLLVWLLNAALRHDLRRDCNWHRKRNMVYFRPSEDLSPRKVKTDRNRSRLVFKGYPRKQDPSKIGFYKHAALHWQFILIDGEWFCELTPDYFYSSDGYRESRYTSDLLRKIKATERNNAVLNETRMWATYLGDASNLLGDTPSILEFGSLMTFEVDRGLDDRTWRRTALELNEEEEFNQEVLFEVSA
jgi:hypothetical protein